MKKRLRTTELISIHAEVEYLKAGLVRLGTAQLIVDDPLVINIVKYDTNIHYISCAFYNSSKITFSTISQYMFLLSNFLSNS